MGLVVLGCGHRARTPADTLVVASEGEVRDLDPRFALTSHETKLSRLIAPGLTTIDQQSLAPAPELAEQITAVDDHTWEVALRAEARFHDGSPVTSADVAYTLESAMDPALGSLYRTSWSERLRRVEVIDPRRLRLHLVEPVATLLSDLDFGIVSRRAALAGGGRFAGGMVVGAGPFWVVSRDAHGVLLERNPHYHGPPPPLRRIDVRTIRDNNARFLVMAGGDVDLIQNGVRMDLVSAIGQRPGVRVESGPSAILTYLMMQTEDPVLRDVRVRQAIALAVDRERIVRAKFHGRARLATGLLPEMHWAYSGDVARYPHDPARAAALLDAAGFPDPDGPGGQPRLRLVYKTSSDQFRLAIARIIAAQLADVGIAVEVRSFEFGTFFNDIKRGAFQLATMQTAPITEPDFLYAYFHSERIPTAADPGLGNRWRYRSPRVDRLTEQGRRVASRERRAAIYQEVQQILAQDLPVVPLWHEDNVVVVREEVTDYQLFPSAGLRGLQHARKRR
jgi:peptide/nickel transport system substrate-binding protein